MDMDGKVRAAGRVLGGRKSGDRKGGYVSPGIYKNSRLGGANVCSDKRSDAGRRVIIGGK